MEQLKESIAATKQLLAEAFSTKASHKIYTLVQLAVEAKTYPWSDDAVIALYQKLFIVQAAISVLQLDFWKRGSCENILVGSVSVIYFANSSSQSTLSPETTNSEQTSVADATELQTPNWAFYQNYDNFFSATRDSVNTLIDTFWQRYQGQDGVNEALAVLALPRGSTWIEVRDRYRQRASASHPDKGGEEAEFVRVRQAFEYLKSCGLWQK